MILRLPREANANPLWKKSFSTDAYWVFLFVSRLRVSKYSLLIKDHKTIRIFTKLMKKLDNWKRKFKELGRMPYQEIRRWARDREDRKTRPTKYNLSPQKERRMEEMKYLKEIKRWKQFSELIKESRKSKCNTSRRNKKKST